MQDKEPRIPALFVTKAGLWLTTASVAWVLSHPAVTSAVIGASRPEQLADTLAAADQALDGELKTQLDEVTREYRQGDAAR
jgi:1-deoxyxylulose-5-phosphate synthase